MDLSAVAVTGFFIALSAACVAAAKALLEVSMPVAMPIGLVGGGTLGMLLIWLSGSLPCSKRK